jgi:apolipoprotein N-acyltransferase
VSRPDEPKLPSESGLHRSGEIVHTIDDDTNEAERIELMLSAERERSSRPASAAVSPSSSSTRLARPQPAARLLDPWRLLAAAATGSAMWISAPDMDIWWLAFVGWVPLLWAIHGRPPKHAFVYGWVAGFVSVFVGFFWMSELLTRFAGFGTLAAAGITGLFALWLGLLWAGSAWITAWLTQRSGRSTLLIYPMAWAAIEFLLPSIFPVYMALSWAWHPLWIQTAEIGGALTVSFVMVAINAAIWETLRARWLPDRGEQPRINKLALGSLAAWMIGVPAYGALRIHQVERQMADAPKLQFGVVQGNFGIDTYSTPAMKPVLLRELQRVTAELDRAGADVVLWGETAYPYGRFTRQHQTDLPEIDRRRIQRDFDVPVIVGLVTRDGTRENPYAWNSAWVLHDDGTWGTRYDKNYPLMFGEAAPPGVDPEWYLDKIPSASHLNRGDGPAVLEVAGYRMGALICYEDILAGFTRDVANQRVNALVNLTNDSWFGKSREQSEHLGLAVYRAIEHRKPLLRSVNAGISAYVDPTGRVIEQLGTTDSDRDGYQGAEGFLAEVPMMPADQRTVYGVLGSLFGWLCVGGLIGVYGWSRHRRAIVAK